MILKTGEGAAAAPFPLPHPGRVPNNGEISYPEKLDTPE
jgi:hypothetical protein